MQEKACIALAVSTNCTKQVHIMLHSVFYNNPDMVFECYIMYFNISDKEKKFYSKIITKAGHRCRFIQFPEINVDKTEYRHVTNETFLRLLIPSVLPIDVKRVLYLDFDIIVNGSLKKLFQYPFGRYSLLAVEANRDQERLQSVKIANKIPYGKKYFNAGVLVMDVEKLRENEHFKKEFVLNFLENRLSEIREDDQGYLNRFLWNQTKIISNKYNYNAAIYYCNGDDIFSRAVSMIRLIKEEKEAEKNAVIIHFRGASKPWDKRYNGQCGKLYCYYAVQAGYCVKIGTYVSQIIAKLNNQMKLLINI